MRALLNNGFLLLLPIFAWNLFFAGILPAAYQPASFWHEIPSYIAYGENSTRALVFLLPLLMRISLKRPLQKIGLWVYLLGLFIYFASWSAQLWWPESNWSQSMYGFTAPAYTSVFWLVGIALLGRDNYLKWPKLSWVYLGCVGLFVFFHSWHAWLVYSR